MRIFAANDVIASTVKEIGKQFRQVGSQHNCLQLFTLQSWSDIFQAFMVEETKRDIYNKVSSIENRVESTITSSSSSSSSSLPWSIDHDHHHHGHDHHHHGHDHISHHDTSYHDQRMESGWSRWRSTSWTLSSWETPSTTGRPTPSTTTDSGRLKRMMMMKSEGKIRVSCQFARALLSLVYLESTPIDSSYHNTPCTFYRTQVYLGADLWVRVSVTIYTFVTLADEVINSIPTDNANRITQGNVGMQVAPSCDQTCN